MKKNLFTVSLSLILALLSITSFAQDDDTPIISHRAPKWVSKTGYWVVESNIHTPRHNVLYFYNNNDVLVYKEVMDGIVLKLNKRKTKMHLKKLVDKTVTAYSQNQAATENLMLVAQLIK